MRSFAPAWRLALLCVLVATTAHATITIGVERAGNGPGSVDTLINQNGFDATATTYPYGSVAGAFGAVDFAGADTWYVPNEGDLTISPTNLAYWSGQTFGRVVVSTLVPDFAFFAPYVGRPVLQNALQWTAGGALPGLVVFGARPLGVAGAPSGWALPAIETDCRPTFVLDPAAAGHPVNAGLPGTESWAFCTVINAFPADVPGWTTLQRDDNGLPVTIARDFCANGTPGDCDGDGIPDASDDCRAAADPEQADGDADGIGDACDVCPTHDNHVDADRDAVPDGCDDCPGVPDPGQADFDADGVGDACDDSDGDGVVDAVDDCRLVANPDQADTDGDRLGDACDPCTDSDRDGFGDPGFAGNTCPTDNCPDDPNPDQADGVGDGVGDACRVCTYLGPLERWALTTTRDLRMSPGFFGRLYQAGTFVSGRACCNRADLASAGIGGNFVAAARTGTAVVWREPPARVDAEENYLGGVQYTGGGRVRAPEDMDVYLFDEDTTGTPPIVGRCNAAMASADDVAKKFASLAPALTLDRVEVRSGEARTIDVPGPVLQIDTLIMRATPGQSFGYGSPKRACLSDEYAYLEIRGASIVNVRKLQIGSCAYMEPFDSSILFNLAGSGPSVRVGFSALVGNILAPDRTITVEGSDYDDEPTFTAGLWAKRIRASGNTELGFNYYCADFLPDDEEPDELRARRGRTREGAAARHLARRPPAGG